MEANKDRSLSRRIQSLQRFLLDKLHHEVMARQPQPSAVPHTPATEGPGAASSGPGAPEVAESTPASPSEGEPPASSDASAQPGVLCYLILSAAVVCYLHDLASEDSLVRVQITSIKA